MRKCYVNFKVCLLCKIVSFNVWLFLSRNIWNIVFVIRYNELIVIIFRIKLFIQTLLFSVSIAVIYVASLISFNKLHSISLQNHTMYIPLPKNVHKVDIALNFSPGVYKYPHLFQHFRGSLDTLRCRLMPSFPYPFPPSPCPIILSVSKNLYFKNTQNIHALWKHSE